MIALSENIRNMHIGYQYHIGFSEELSSENNVYVL